MEGLTPELHRMILANMQLATANIDDVINAAEYYTNFTRAGPSSSTPLAPPRSNPMAMDLDHLQVMFNALMQAQQQPAPMMGPRQQPTPLHKQQQQR